MFGSMTLTTEHAALISQVFPTLVIALMLEIRFLRGPKWVAWINVLHHAVRWMAIVGAIISTFACLEIAGGKPPSGLDPWIVNLSMYALMFAFTFMAGAILGRESNEVGEILREKRERTPTDAPEVRD